MGPGKTLDSRHVENLQRDLKCLGYYTGEIDGIYGTETVKAVKNFEKDNKLTTNPKGYAGPKVKNCLFAKSYVYYDFIQEEKQFPIGKDTTTIDNL